jgi:hypothetical protein
MAHRTIRDDAGIEWEVWEVRPSSTERRYLADRRGIRRSTDERRTITMPRLALPGQLRKGWLAFRSRFERRRVAPVPAGWAALSEAELRRLLRGSRLSGPTRRLPG